MYLSAPVTEGFDNSHISHPEERRRRVSKEGMSGRCFQKGHPSRRYAPQGEGALVYDIVIPDPIRDPERQVQLVPVALDTKDSRKKCNTARTVLRWEIHMISSVFRSV